MRLNGYMSVYALLMGLALSQSLDSWEDQGECVLQMNQSVESLLQCIAD